jgi:hypothetical protein
MVLILVEEGDKFYSKKNDKLKIGEADLEYVVYVFYENKFYGVDILCKGINNYNKIKETLIKTYGKRYIKGNITEKYVWLGDNVSIVLTYDDVSKEGSLVYMYMPIKREKDRDDQLKAKSGADDL